MFTNGYFINFAYLSRELFKFSKMGVGWFYRMEYFILTIIVSNHIEYKHVSSQSF